MAWARRGPPLRVTAILLPIAGGLSLIGAAAGCGDPMLPSDYTGGPGGAVMGTVEKERAELGKDAVRPRLSLEWLTPRNERGASPLVGQALSFQRSEKLQTDWEIGLAQPEEAAKLDTSVASRPMRLAVGKMVYYDDRVADGRLDWRCRSATCDQVKAVSAEFVVYVEATLACPGGGTAARRRLSSGYHYYSYDGQTIRELGKAETMRFVVRDPSLAESDPTQDLRAFLDKLVSQWSTNALQGC